jgi:Zn-dependent protease with chaperone function
MSSFQISWRIFLRWTALVASLWFPLACFAGLVGRFPGIGIYLGICLIFVLIFLLWMSFSAEGLLRRLLHVQDEVPAPLTRSLAAVCYERGETPPSVAFFRDPAPQILAVKSLRSEGTIFVSQGLIAVLDEEELRDILQQTLGRLQSPDMLVRSLAATLAIRALRISPPAWVSLFFGGQTLAFQQASQGSALSFIRFSILLPWVRFFLARSIPLQRELRRGDALQKIEGLIGSGGFLGVPGADYLYLPEMRFSRSLLPL